MQRIFLEDGEHDEKGLSVIIDYSVSIVGESREHCIVMGRLWMRGKKEDDIAVCIHTCSCICKGTQK